MITVLGRASGRDHAASPWTGADAARVASGFLLGGALLFVAWAGSSGEATTDQQFAWLNLAIVGTLLSALAAGLWVFHGQRAVRSRIARILPEIPEDAATSPEPGAAAGSGTVFAAAPAMTRYHQPGCVLLTGKNVEFATRASHERAGRRGCEMCSS